MTVLNPGRSHISSVNVATRSRGSRTRNRGSISGRGRYSSLLYDVRAISGEYPASHLTDNGGPFPGRKAARLRRSLILLSAEIKNAWSYTYTSPYAFMAWCLINHRDISVSHQRRKMWYMFMSSP
jgi:hypothetical protein